MNLTPIKKIHWKRWSVTPSLIEGGGLGLWDVECFNEALIARQTWRIIQELAGLRATILNQCIFKISPFLIVRTSRVVLIC